MGQSPVYQACVLLRIPNALAPHFERIHSWEHLLDQESCSWWTPICRHLAHYAMSCLDFRRKTKYFKTMVFVVCLFVFAGLQALKKAGRYYCGSKLLILFVLPFSRCDACPCTSHHHKQLMTASGSSMTADALDFVSLALFHLALQKQARLVHKKQRALLRHLYGDYIVNQFILHNPMDHLLLMIRHFSSSDNLSIK